MKVRITIIFLLMFFSLSAFPQVILSEMMSNNKSIIKDEDGEFVDWIELYNTGTQAINLEGFYLTDDSTKKNKWIFPPLTIEVENYKIVFVSGKDRISGNIHCSFKINQDGEGVYLYDPQLNLVSKLSVSCIPADYSYGTFPDASDENSYFKNPTPGFTNDGTSITVFQFEKDTVLFSHAAGSYTSSFSLSLSRINSSNKIIYTIDGSTPQENDWQYIDPITIQNNSFKENVYSDISTSPFWRTPSEKVYKANVIRARAFVNGCPVSKTVTNSYFVGNELNDRYRFDILSLTSDPSNLFGNKNGIYVGGENADIGGNFTLKGEEWEREAHLELFRNGTKHLDWDIDIRTHGRYSRLKPQKSLRIYTQDSISFNFFPDKNISSYKRLILRTTDTHASTTLFKDELCSMIIKDLNIDYQSYLPLIVFVDGEYWGIHNLRERQDKFYVQNNFNTDPENIDMLEFSLDADEEIEGDKAEYDQLINFIETHDLSINENYLAVSEKIDIDNFIDYQISHIYFSNYDWPRNNVRTWKSKGPEGKWRFMFFDCDVCMIEDDYNHLFDFLSGNEKYDRHTLIFRSLLKNEQFKQLFVSIFFNYLNTVFSPSKLLPLVNEFEIRYSPMVQEHINRWHMPENFSIWSQNVQELKSFVVKRPLELFTQLTGLFGMPFKIYPNPAISTLRLEVFGSSTANVQVFLYNALGNKIMEGNLNDGISDLNLSNVSSGLYYIRIIYGNMIFNEKITVLKN